MTTESIPDRVFSEFLADALNEACETDVFQLTANDSGAPSVTRAMERIEETYGEEGIKWVIVGLQNKKDSTTDELVGYRRLQTMVRAYAASD